MRPKEQEGGIGGRKTETTNHVVKYRAGKGSLARHGNVGVGFAGSGTEGFPPPPPTVGIANWRQIRDRLKICV